VACLAKQLVHCTLNGNRVGGSAKRLTKIENRLAGSESIISELRDRLARVESMVDGLAGRPVRLESDMAWLKHLYKSLDYRIWFILAGIFVEILLNLIR